MSDCYSSGDRKWMHLSQLLRHRLLKPILCLLSHYRVTANQITCASLITGLLFYPLLSWSIYGALFFLYLHVLLDGLDGPLARYTKTDSRAGSLTDTFCDQIVICVTMIALIDSAKVSLLPGILYIFLYTLVIAFSMIRNSMEIPYRFLFRPRFLIYVWIPIDWFWIEGSLNCVTIMMLFPLVWCSYSGFRKIRTQIQ